MLETFRYKERDYLRFQSEGNAAQFIIPFAKHLCKGRGVDIGCNREDWKFPGAFAVDPIMTDFHALDFPYSNLDYIFSSHCLEHLQNWVQVLNYWTEKLRSGGVLFLYLPDYCQEYWRPWNNRTHLNIFNSQIICDYLKDHGYKNIFSSGVDLNCSFTVVGEKI